ncbi:hypothetical protein [Fodinicola feengrottensis]|nr:hypothetical protein [Fodinicola feengrottensis]
MYGSSCFIDVVYGVLWYRLLLDHAPLSEAAGRELAALVVRAAGQQVS